jgi:hypothetical protein
VAGGARLRVEPFAGPPEARRLLAEARRLLAEQQWPLVAARKRVLCGVYDD